MRRYRASLILILLGVGCTAPNVDLLLRGGEMLDGSGGASVDVDVAVQGDRIVFVGDADAEGITAAKTLDVSGLLVTPGFIDMHSHSVLHEDYGHRAEPFLYQGITTVVLGVDGGGTPHLRERFAGLTERGIGVNTLSYVGHAAVRREVVGMEDRKPTDEELDQMRALVRQGMEQGAFGLSTGLFYVPGYYAETEEVIELAKVAAVYGGLYDTHDRDLGASYRGIGYLASIREGIAIGEASGTSVIFSHFNAQGRANYGRAAEGAALIDAARARGVDVWAAQHVYTATQSSLRAYAIPRWASAGGHEALLERFDDPAITKRLDVETMEMLDIRGGAQRILIVDPRPELNGRTLANVAEGWELSVAETVRRILRDGNASVMNLELYDDENTRFLARQDWMMTCTDGRDPRPNQAISHPRVYGAFTKKVRDFVLDDDLLTMPFAIRSMTGLASDFLRLPERGYLREGAVADIAVFDRERIRDRATYASPKQFSEGTVHVLVNGILAVEDGATTGALAGRTLLRPASSTAPAGDR